MIELKSSWQNYIHTLPPIFSQNQLHPSLLQFSNPPSGNLFPIPGQKQFERRRFSIIPFTLLNRPIITLQVDPKIDSQTPIPREPASNSNWNERFSPKKGRRIFESTPVSISRHIPWTLCASLLCEAIVCDQYGWASPGACYGRRLRRPQLSLSTPSVETENPFKALTRDPLLCISFLPRFSFKEGGKGDFSLAISKNGSSFSRWKWKKGDGDGWRWFDPTGFETVWLRVLVIARNRMDDVCDWILVQFNPGLDSMNFLKGDAPLGIWGFAVVKSEFCAAA